MGRSGARDDLEEGRSRGGDWEEGEAEVRRVAGVREDSRPEELVWGRGVRGRQERGKS